jgi:hypothetical protein
MKRFSCFVFAHGMNCLAASSSAAAAAWCVEHSVCRRIFDRQGHW